MFGIFYLLLSPILIQEFRPSVIVSDELWWDHLAEGAFSCTVQLSVSSVSNTMYCELPKFGCGLLKYTFIITRPFWTMASHKSKPDMQQQCCHCHNKYGMTVATLLTNVRGFDYKCSCFVFLLLLFHKFLKTNQHFALQKFSCVQKKPVGPVWR